MTLAPLILAVVWLSGSEGPSAVVDAPNLTGRVVESRYDGTNDYLTIYLTHDLDRAPSVAVDYLAKFATNTVYGTWLGGWTNKVDVGATGITTSDYVQDGLVAMFDGVENAGRGVHDPEANYWTELVSGGKMPFVGNPVVADNRLKCPSVTDGVSCGQYTYQTIEVCVARFGGSYNIVNPTSSSYVKYGIIFVSGYCGNASGSPKVTFADYAVPHTVSMTFGATSHGYGDGVLQSATYTDYWTVGAGTLNYSSYNASRGGIADYYSVRLYSRELTPEEIAANYAIDRERFVLGHAYRAKYADCRILVVRRPIGLRSADARPSLRVSYGSATVPFAVRGVDITVNSNAVEIVDGILKKKGN